MVSKGSASGRVTSQIGAKDNAEHIIIFVCIQVLYIITKEGAPHINCTQITYTLTAQGRSRCYLYECLLAQVSESTQLRHMISRV